MCVEKIITCSRCDEQMAYSFYKCADADEGECDFCDVIKISRDLCEECIMVFEADEDGGDVSSFLNFADRNNFVSNCLFVIMKGTSHHAAE